MPTNEKLWKYSIDELLIMLRWVLKQAISPYSAMHVIQDVYEIVIVILCKRAGKIKATNDTASEYYVEWDYLKWVRNSLAHDLAFTSKCVGKIDMLLKSDLLVRLSVDLLGTPHAVGRLVSELRKIDADEFKASIVDGNANFVVGHGRVFTVDEICNDLIPAVVKGFNTKHACAEAYKETWYKTKFGS